MFSDKNFGLSKDLIAAVQKIKTQNEEKVQENVIKNKEAKETFIIAEGDKIKALAKALGTLTKVKRSDGLPGPSMIGAYKNERAKQKNPEAYEAMKKQGITTEEIENLDELSKKTLGSYVKKASVDVSNKALSMGSDKNKKNTDTAGHFKGISKRIKGVSKATDKLVNADVFSEGELASIEEKLNTLDIIGGAIAGGATAALAGGLPVVAGAVIGGAAGALSNYGSDEKSKDPLKDPLKDKKKVLKTGINAAPVEEQVEPLEELSKKTLGSYVKKASRDIKLKSHDLGWKDAMERPGSPNKKSPKIASKITKRQKGVNKAVDKLTTEELERLDEISQTLRSKYVGAAIKDIGQNQADENSINNTMTQTNDPVAKRRLAQASVELDNRSFKRNKGIMTASSATARASSANLRKTSAT